MQVGKQKLGNKFNLGVLFITGILLLKHKIYFLKSDRYILLDIIIHKQYFFIIS